MRPTPRHATFQLRPNPMTPMLSRVAIAVACVLCLMKYPSLHAAGLDPETNIDGFDPAAESFRVNEARRLNQISRQLDLNYRMIWEHGFNPANPPVRQPIGYESKQVSPNRWIYRPVYPEQVTPQPESGPELLPLPSAAAPPTVQPKPAAQAPGPADAQSGDRIVRPNPLRPNSAPQPLPRGPREF